MSKGKETKKITLEFNGRTKRLALGLDWPPEFILNFVCSSFGQAPTHFSQFLPIVDPKGNTYSLVGSLQELDSNIPYKLEIPNSPLLFTPPKEEKDLSGLNGQSTAKFFMPSGARSRKDSRQLGTPPTFDRRKGKQKFFEDQNISIFKEGFHGFGDLDHFIVSDYAEFIKIFMSSSFQVGLLVSTQKDSDRGVFPPEITALLKKYMQEVGLYFMPIRQSGMGDERFIKFSDYSSHSGLHATASFFTKDGRSKELPLETALGRLEQEMTEMLEKKSFIIPKEKPKSHFSHIKLVSSDTNPETSPFQIELEIKRKILEMLETSEFKAKLPRVLRYSLINQIREDYPPILKLFHDKTAKEITPAFVLAQVIEFSSKSSPQSKDLFPDNSKPENFSMIGGLNPQDFHSHGAEEKLKMDHLNPYDHSVNEVGWITSDISAIMAPSPKGHPVHLNPPIFPSEASSGRGHHPSSQNFQDIFDSESPPAIRETKNNKTNQTEPKKETNQLSKFEKFCIVTTSPF